MKCPYCKETIDDDSRFCDQCGKELCFCPDCRQPKRGTECPSCGADLVDAAHFFAAAPSDQIQHDTTTATTSVTGNTASTSAKTPAAPTRMEGEGLVLTLKEGVFGRTTGIYPEFSSKIYISGRHGELRCVDGQWQVRDLGSHNGTFLNGAKLQTNVWVDLHIGDLLKIATTLMTLK